MADFVYKDIDIFISKIKIYLLFQVYLGTVNYTNALK